MAESVARPTAFRLERGSNLTPLRGSKAYPALMDTGPRLGPNLREGRKWPHYLLIPLGQDVGCATCLKVTLTKRTPPLFGLVLSHCLAPFILVFSNTSSCCLASHRVLSSCQSVVFTMLAPPTTLRLPEEVLTLLLVTPGSADPGLRSSGSMVADLKSFVTHDSAVRWKRSSRSIFRVKRQAPAGRTPQTWRALSLA